MKKILIYKPSWNAVFHEKSIANTFANPEIVNLAYILSKKYKVVIGSDCDLTKKGNPRKIKDNEKDFDIRILLNGKLYTKEDDDINTHIKMLNDMKNIEKLFKKEDFYFITDLKILERCKFFTDNYNFKIVSQSKNLGKYGDLEKTFIFNKDVDISPKEKKLVYCGNQRNNARTDLVTKYLLGNEIKTEIYGKWTNPIITNNPNFKNLLSCEEVPKTLAKSKYSLIISDKEYREIGFITPRYWECLLSSTIPFIDSTYDKDEIIVKKNDFRIIHDYNEMINKIKFLEENEHFYKKILEKQTKEIKQSYVNGNYLLSKLVNILEK